MKPWFLYFIRCRDTSLYAGITTDVKRRFKEHGNNNGKGAKYLKGKKPLNLVWYTEIGDKSTALKVEHSVKKLPKAKKEMIIAGRINIRDI